MDIREEKKLELETNQQHYYSLYQYNPDLVLTFNLEGKILNVNKIEEAYGYTEEEVLQNSFDTFLDPKQSAKTQQHFKKATRGEPTNYNSALVSKKGELFKFNVTNIPIIINEQIVGVYGILKDITEYENAQKAKMEAELKYRNLLEDTLVGIYIIQDGEIVYVNKRLLEMLNYSEEQVIGRLALDFVVPEDRIILGENLRNRMRNESSSVRYQYRAIKKNKSIIHVDVIGSETIYEGKPALMGNIIDITEQKRAEKTIEYLAYHDSLTGLYNRHHFYNQLKTAITDNHIKKLAVLFFDLDRFKFINDSMGHGIGDRLLKAVSERLKTLIFKQIDLARYGGDEFIVSLSNISQQEALDIARRVLKCFESPFYIDQYELFITPSIGISLYPDNGKDAETLIKNADIAMYEAKQKGSNNFQFYHYSNQAEQIHEKLEIEADLRKALEREEYQLYYQPKVNLTTGKISGVEALIRWQHPEKGLISPAEFIPLAEETGLILLIGEWALRTACLQNKYWQRSGLPPMSVSVNLSVRQLYQPNIIEMVKRVIEETGLEPKYLEFEITESMLMDTKHGLKVLKQLKGLGVQLSLDDFGTGYSSLHYLKEFPIDKLKIDQSFIRNCTMDRNDATIVKTIIAMAHQLNLEVIAEGVELKDHLVFLQRNLCNTAQGYLLSRPLPPDELLTKMEDIEKIISENGIPQEISRRKWLEEELEQARQELRDTIRQQQGMIFKYIKRNGKFIHTLCDGELLYRIGLSPETLSGKELHDVLPFNEAERKLQFYRRAWEEEENVTYEGNLNGIWYFASLKAIRRGGEVVEVIGSCVDITDRKESEERFQKVVEFFPKGIVIHQDGEILYANPSSLKIVKEKDLVRKSIYHYLHPDSLLYSKQRLSQTEEGKELPVTEIKLIRRDEEVINVEVGSVSINYDGSPAILTIYSDVTEKRRAEEALIQSEEKYRLIANNMQDLIGILDKDGVVKYASPSYENSLGFPPEMYEGKMAFDMVHPDDIPYLQKQYRSIVLSKLPCSVEFRYKHVNGNWVDVKAIGTPALDEKGELKQIIVVARNIKK